MEDISKLVIYKILITLICLLLLTNIALAKTVYIQREDVYLHSFIGATIGEWAKDHGYPELGTLTFVFLLSLFKEVVIDSPDGEIRVDGWDLISGPFGAWCVYQW